MLAELSATFQCKWTLPTSLKYKNPHNRNRGIKIIYKAVKIKIIWTKIFACTSKKCLNILYLQFWNPGSTVQKQLLQDQITKHPEAEKPNLTLHNLLGPIQCSRLVLSLYFCLGLNSKSLFQSVHPFHWYLRNGFWKKLISIEELNEHFSSNKT